MDYLNLLGRIRARGMTQSDVAQKIGISPTTLNKKLRGHTDFTQTEIRDLCRVLAIPDAEIPAYFFAAKLQFSQVHSKGGEEDREPQKAQRTVGSGTLGVERCTDFAACGRVGQPDWRDGREQLVVQNVELPYHNSDKSE